MSTKLIFKNPVVQKVAEQILDGKDCRLLIQFPGNIEYYQFLQNQIKDLEKKIEANKKWLLLADLVKATGGRLDDCLEEVEEVSE